MTKAQTAERNEAIAELREMIQQGDTIYTTLKKVSASGMSRCIDVRVIKDNKPIWLSSRVALALGKTYDEKTQSVRIRDCGMDMGFAIVYNLARVLFPEEKGTNQPDPAYLLNQKWM